MLSVLVPARNSRAMTEACLVSLDTSLSRLGLAGTGRVEFVLIDDDSTRESGILELFQNFRRLGKYAVKIARFKRWQHYTGVFSCGLTLAEGSVCLFVSNDMLVTADFIRTVLAVGSLDDRIGIVRGTSPYTDSHPEHVVAPPAPLRGYDDIAAFSSWMAGYHGMAFTYDRLLSGDAVAVKRSLIDKIGVMDLRFFGYFGDVDYGLRARRAGFHLVCAKGAWLFHHGAGHIRSQSETLASQSGTAVQDVAKSLHQDRMKLVNDAYLAFRQKWDPSLPPRYSDISHIDFDKLTASTAAVSEYEKPMALPGEICEIV